MAPHGSHARRLGALLLLVLCSGVASQRVRAEERRPRPETRGLGWALGGGNQFAGLGLSLLYFVPVRDSRVTLTPNLGFGYMDLAAPRAIDTSAGTVTGFSAGLTASYGYRHRLSTDFGFGLSGAAGLAVQGILVDAVGLYGPFLHVGYEFLGARGFLFRFCPLGVSYHTSALVPRDDRIAFAASAGLGWKLW